MSGRMRRTLPMGLLLVGVLAVGFAFHHWRNIHSDTVTKVGRAAGLDCYSCHKSGFRPVSRPVGRPHPSPSALAITADGSRLFVSCEGTGEIVVLDPVQRVPVARWEVGKSPHGLALSPDGEILYVALKGEHRVAALHARTGEEVASVGVGHAPCGIALDPAGENLVVANSGSHDISVVRGESLVEVCRLAAGREPYAVAISLDGRRALVANRLSNPVPFRSPPVTEVTIVDLESRSVVSRPRAESAHLAEGLTLASAGGPGVVSLIRVRNLVPISQVSQGWVMTSALGLVRQGEEKIQQFPLDDVNAYFADPSGVVVNPRDGRAYIASGGGNCVSVVDLERLEEIASRGDPSGPGELADNLGISSEYVIARIPVGSNPRSLLLGPEGKHVYVAEKLADAVAIIDTGSLTVAGRITLGGPTKPDRVHRGEILFHNADITFQGQFSCRSCHPDGHQDGLAYDFDIDGLGKNILDNRSLLGLAGTAPFKWNGKNKDLHQQCGPRFAMVLTRSDPFTPEQLDDLVAYILSLPPPTGSLSSDAEVNPVAARGERLFTRTQTNDGEEIPEKMRCPSCHLPPLYTNNMPSSVGTIRATDTVKEFDTPHLLGIGASAPYLHDGQAMTLEEIWTVFSTDDSHGIVNDLTKEQLNELVEFLKSL